MIGKAVLNAETFIGGNHLVKALGGGDESALDEKKRHGKALEAYQAAYAKYSTNPQLFWLWPQCFPVSWS